jgi:alkaline phosphatase D
MQSIIFYHFLFLFAISNSISFSQNTTGLISGPWPGNVELRNATIWLEVSPTVKSISVKFNKEGNASTSKIVSYKGKLGKDFNPVKIELNGLDFNTSYTYSVSINNKPVILSYPLKFTTKDLWEHRKPAPDFTFLTGSCAYFNEPEYDRPGKPYGGDSSIFETMAKLPAAFHLWLGDNWYTREVDYSSAWGLSYRASRDRSLPVLQKFMSSMPQYAIWDDHDFGPDNSGKSYILKEESRKVFMNYWCNPSYGEEGKGIYTKISYSDVDLFLTDDRYFRSDGQMPDSINGLPDAAKTFLGQMQMKWLKDALLFSKATFKIIAVGNQVLNSYTGSEDMKNYSAEYIDLINFINAQKVKGVLIFTGDKHHSEVIKYTRKGLYPLVEEQNFGKVTVSGKKNERILKVEFIGLKGNTLAEWSVKENEINDISTGY